MAVLPPEIWSHIFSFFSSIDELVESSVASWARIASNDALHLNTPSHTVVEGTETKRALGLVSKAFYELSRPIVLEYITVRKIDVLQFLALQVKERPELSSTMTLYTKRVDFQLDPVDLRVRVPPLITDRRSAERAYYRILEDLEAILKACPNVTYFTYRICDDSGISYGDRTSRNRTVLDIIRDSCPHIEVIRYDTGRIFTARSHNNALPLFPKLRVLEFSEIGRMDFTAQREPYELPFLHTLIGPIDLICEKVRSVHLPALNTVIYKPRISRLLSAAERRAIRQFFCDRSELIRSVDLRYEHPHGLHSEFLVNTTEIVFPTDTDNFTYASLVPRCLNGLQTIGITDTGTPGDQALDTVSYILLTIISQKEEGNLANLKTIRIIGDQFVRRLRERRRTKLRLIERRVRGWGIVLEDGYGCLLVL